MRPTGPTPAARLAPLTAALLLVCAAAFAQPGEDATGQAKTDAPAQRDNGNENGNGNSNGDDNGNGNGEEAAEPRPMTPQPNDPELLAAEREDEAQWLEAGEEEWLALYRPSERAETHGLAILAYTGDPPAWPRALEALRRGLPHRGWATLAISLPTGEAPEGWPQAAAGFAAERDLAAALVLDNRSAAKLPAPPWALADGDLPGESPLAAPLRALVLVHMQPRVALSEAALTELFAPPQLPVLDVFWEPGGPGAADVRQRHRRLGRSQLDNYRQLTLPGPDSLGNPQSYWVQRVSGYLHRQLISSNRRSPQRGDGETSPLR